MLNKKRTMAGLNLAACFLVGMLSQACGDSSSTDSEAQPKVAEGDEIDVNNFKSSVKILAQDGGNHEIVCTGVFINSEWLVTTHSCLKPWPQHSLKVNIPYLRRDLSVERVEWHSFQLKNNVPVGQSFDLALIKVRRNEQGEAFPAEHASRISDTQTYPRQYRFEGVGFGIRDQWQGRPNGKLTRTDGLSLKGNWGLEDQEILLSGPKQACHGDFGGGAFDKNGRLVGLASRHFSYYLSECNQTDGVLYTNLRHHAVRNWLRATTGIDSI